MRRITSIILALAFAVVAVTGVQLAAGHVSREGGKPPGVEQQLPARNSSAGAPAAKAFYPKEAHQWAGFVMVGAGLVHVGLNIRPMLSYLRGKR